jgi:hypothetical protein
MVYIKYTKPLTETSNPDIEFLSNSNQISNRSALGIKRLTQIEADLLDVNARFEKMQHQINRKKTKDISLQHKVRSTSDAPYEG